jgi:hypothetical protein
VPNTTPPTLLSLRAVVIFMAALLIGGAAGLLTYLAQHNEAQAALAAGAAFASSIGLLNGIIARN